MGRGRMMRGKLYDTITARTMHVNKRVRRMDVFLETRNGRKGLINLTFDTCNYRGKPYNVDQANSRLL